MSVWVHPLAGNRDDVEGEDELLRGRERHSMSGHGAAYDPIRRRWTDFGPHVCCGADSLLCYYTFLTCMPVLAPGQDHIRRLSWRWCSSQPLPPHTCRRA